MKITQKSLSELPEGVHQIETNFFIRVEAGTPILSLFTEKRGEEKRLP